MSSRVAEMGTWRIGDTQDAETMFMIGTDVESCQSVYDKPGTQWVLSGYSAGAQRVLRWVLTCVTLQATTSVCWLTWPTPLRAPSWCATGWQPRHLESIWILKIHSSATIIDRK